jgi:protein O-mannosyl-transferase
MDPRAAPSPAAGERTRREQAPGVRARRPAWPIGASAALAVLLYLPSVRWGFVWDDRRLIEHNPLLHSWAGLVRLLTGDFWMTTGRDASGLWRPLVTASYAVDGALSQFHPGWFRAMNVAGHAGCSALVAALALGAGAPGWAALVAGGWFAAMPAHVESVAWIAGRTDVYCAVAFLGALWADRRAREAGRRWPGVWAAGLLAVALLAKETALPFAGVVGVMEVVRGTRWGAALRWVTPYVIVTAAYALVHALLVRAPGLPAWLDPVTVRRGTWAVPEYLGGYIGFLWPFFPHSPAVTLRLPEHPWEFAVVAGIALHVALVAVLVGLLARRDRAAIPVALFAITLTAPAAAMFVQSNQLYAERFIYLPSAGAAWLLGMLVARARPVPVRGIAAALATALVVASAVVTVRTLPDWRDDATLFEAMAHTHPRNVMGRLGWARQLAVQGRDQEAARELDAAAALDSSRAELWSVRALLRYRVGDWPAVLALSGRALALDSLVLEPRIEHATALLRLGRLAEADAELDRLRSEVPGDPAVQALWGERLVMTGRGAQAEPVLADAARHLPDDADLFWALGMARGDVRDAAGAEAAFRRALAVDPGFYDAWLRLATLAHLRGAAGTRDSALERAAALPQAADGRVELLRHRFAAGPP